MVVGHYISSVAAKVGTLHNKSAVFVFIILSGFVITRLLCVSRKSYPEFITRRFLRLWPVYGLCLAFSVLTLSLQADGLRAWPWSTPENGVRAQVFESVQATLPMQVWAHLPMLHGLVPPSVLRFADVGLVGQAWSISVEWQFYVLAPLVVWLVARRQWPILAAFGLALLALGVAPLWAANSGFMPRYTIWFAIGIASYYAWEHRRRVWVQRASIAFALVLLGAALALREAGFLVWGLVFPALIIDAPVSRILRTALTLRTVKLAGKASYSTYLVHMFPLYLGMALVERLPVSPVVGAALTIAGALVATALLSWISCILVELPSIDLGRQLWRHRRSKLAERQEVLTAP